MVSFIDDHREVYGVEPICRVIPIAPSTYYAHKALAADPTRRSARAQRDECLRREIDRVWQENFRVYGAEKTWRQLNREGIRVARCTVERLMRDKSLEGTVRGPSRRTTIPADESERPKWIWWFNHHRLLSSIGHVPPVEYEELFDGRQIPHNEAVALTQMSLR